MLSGEHQRVAAVDGGPLRGAPASFEDFYRQEHARLVRLVRALTGSLVVAEDVVQEAFAVTHQRWAHVRDVERPDLWVRRVAIDRAVGLARRRSSEQRALARLTRYGMPSLVAVHPEPDGSDQRIIRAILALPRRQRQVVGLVYLDDQSIEDAATTLGLDPSTVRTHLMRARSALAEALALSDDEPSGQPDDDQKEPGS